MSTPTRTKIGNVEVKVTIEFLKNLRERIKQPDVKEIAAKYMVAEKLQPEYPTFSCRTLEEYIGCMMGSSDFIFGLVVDQKLSIGMMKELTSGELDMASRDTLTRLALERKMSPSQIATVKRTLKNAKKPTSLHEAVMRASGEIPEHARPEHVKESIKTFGKIVGEVSDSAVKFMTKLQSALDLLPHTAIAHGESYMDVYEKIVTFENTLDNSLLFVRERKKRFFEALKQHIVAEAEMTQIRTEGPKGGEG